MKIAVKFASLHNPLFLAGTNLQDKLDPTKRQGMILTYDRVEKELLVQFNGEVALVPSSNIASVIPSDSSQFLQQPTPAQSLPAPKPFKGKAQVQTPTDHVFAEAPGKVR